MLDGVYMLQSVTWPTADCSYEDVCDVYVSRVVSKFGGPTNCSVIFDGYDDPTHSTKLIEQERRAAKNTAATIIFSLYKIVKTKQQDFLAANYHSYSVLCGTGVARQ